MRVLLAISTALIVAGITAVMVFFLHRTRLGPLLHKHIPDRPLRDLGEDELRLTRDQFAQFMSEFA